MKYTKLNIGWGAEPNAPEPQVNVDYSDANIYLSFFVNPFMYKSVEEDTRAQIEFKYLTFPFVLTIINAPINVYVHD